MCIVHPTIYPDLLPMTSVQHENVCVIVAIKFMQGSDYVSSKIYLAMQIPVQEHFCTTGFVYVAGIKPCTATKTILVRIHLYLI